MPNRKIFIAIFVLITLTNLCNPSFAWIRDANIADSRDSIGLGWYLGLSISGEKRLDDKSSIGFYYLPQYDPPLSKSYKNSWDVTYNKQIAGEKDDSFASSFYIGAIGMEASSSGGHTSGAMPYLGFTFSWKLNPHPAKFRLNIIYYLPLYFEFGYKFSENIELAAALGYPFQLISLRYCF